MPDDVVVEDDGLIYREEVVGILFAVTDLNAGVQRIIQLLEDELGGEEAFEEDDT